jgi:hypothetical protein
MDGQDVQDSDPDLILFILSIHVNYSFFPWAPMNLQPLLPPAYTLPYGFGLHDFAACF